MIFLYILLSLIGVVVLLLFVNVNLILTLAQEPDFKIRVLFFTFDAKKLIAKFQNAEPSDSEEPTDKPRKKVKLTLERLKYLINRFIELVKAVTHEICRYVRVEICHVYVKVATDDAADTARAYGTVSAIVWSLLEFLSYNMKVKRCDKKVVVYPDFESCESQIDIKLVLRIKPIHVLCATMHLLPVFMKGKVGNK